MPPDTRGTQQGCVGIAAAAAVAATAMQESALWRTRLLERLACCFKVARGDTTTK